MRNDEKKISSFIIHHSSFQGFTLIEVLVAMMILAISLGVILELFSGALRSNRISSEYTRAIFLAKAKMEEILLVSELTDGEISGEFTGDFRWKADITYIEPEEGQTQAVDLFRITVDISWVDGNRERHFEISTLKIAKHAVRR